ncbi:hypothetical protein [uncultured Dysosmobacter sp.]|uniref:hypothetical protein n=1 Tax=uncultured Dysosmobacter sp. TaxID=2591384 RepID=UPI002621C7C4|nr:hypothetical protein [uncultured Dysosmobacter sp.]
MGINIRNPRQYMENFLYIRDKKQRLVPLKLKPAQENLYQIIKEEHQAGRPVRLIVLKGRQEGISTVTEALMFQDAATRPLVNTLIVAHRDDATANLFRMNKLFYDCLPQSVQPMKKASNAKELVFENPTRDEGEKRRRPGLRSRIKCVTAGGKGAGRSDTLTNVHLSEYAFWPGDKKGMLAGIMQAVPDDPNTMVIIESTANGFDDFKELWDGAVEGTNGWRPVFLPWYMEPEYRRPVEPGTIWTDEEKKMMGPPPEPSAAVKVSRESGEKALWRGPVGRGEARKRFEPWAKGRGEYSGLCLDEEQLAWRRWCIRVNFGGDEQLFRQEYPNTPDEAFLLSGDPYFDNDVIMARRRAVQEPLRTGLFEHPEPEIEGGAPRDWGFVDREKGFIRIYEEPKPGVPYVLGGDTAGEGSDCFTAHVLDNTDGHQVAELQQPLSEILYARQVYCLGHYYNDALAAIEVNFSTYPEMKLEEWHYPNLYQRERFDTFTGEMVKAFGWITSSRTRQVMLAELHTVMEEAPELVASFQTLGEMLTFVYGKGRKPQAAEGEHDDLVMAAAIAHQARRQQRCTVDRPGGEKVRWTADMWEDYQNAGEEVRRMLVKKWGPPA